MLTVYFPGSSSGTESAYNAGDPGSIPGSGMGFPVAQQVRICLQCGKPGFNPWVGKIPWRRERLPTPVVWPGEFHELYSPWGLKEPDMTEQL